MQMNKCWQKNWKQACLRIPNCPRRIKILFCNVATTVCRPRTFGFADPAVMTPSCATFLTTLWGYTMGSKFFWSRNSKGLWPHCASPYEFTRISLRDLSGCGWQNIVNWIKSTTSYEFRRPGLPVTLIPKGQLISKGHFDFFNSPKKWTKNFCPSRLG